MQETNRRPDLVWTAEADDSLLAFLLRHVKGKSRNNIKSMLARGQVSVDGRTATRFDHPVAVGSRVAVKAHVEEEVPGLPFPILYEDRDILVIDKPAGLLTIANEKEKVRTAYHMLTDYVRQESKFGRVFVVHRLDRDTSGVVLFAKNEETKRAFQEDWDARVLRRGYRALVEGRSPAPGGRGALLPAGDPHPPGLLGRPRPGRQGGRHPLSDSGLRRGVRSAGDRPEDGPQEPDPGPYVRLGHPIAGDRQYGARTRPLGRLCLHAHRLELIDPRSGEKRVFAAREPAAFRRLCRGGARS